MSTKTIRGLLFALSPTPDGLPFCSIYTPPQTDRDRALKDAIRVFYGINPLNQLIFLHDDGEVELWNPGMVGQGGSTAKMPTEPTCFCGQPGHWRDIHNRREFLCEDCYN